MTNIFARKPAEIPNDETAVAPEEPSSQVVKDESGYANEPPLEYTAKQLEDAQKQVDYYNEGRLPPLANTTTEVMQDIYTPDRDIQNEFDQFHALKDWTLTYTKNNEERDYLMIGGHLVTACEYNGLHRVAQAVNAEDKRFAALLRSHNFAQQRELRSTRQFVEGREKKDENKGFFNFLKKEE